MQVALWWRLLKTVTIEWIEKRAITMGAAMAYYAVFAIAPMLVIALTITSWILGPQVADDNLELTLRHGVGSDGAEAIMTTLDNVKYASSQKLGKFLFSIVVLFWAASNLFSQMKESLNVIWEAEAPKKNGFIVFLIDRLVAILMVIIVSLLLLGFMGLNAMLNAAGDKLANYVIVPEPLLQVGNLAISFVFLVGILMMIYRFVPDIRTGWKSVALWAVVTAVLIVTGKYVISIYLAFYFAKEGARTTSYDAANSLVFILIWVYFTSMIFFFGAIFTHVYSRLKHLPVQIAHGGHSADEAAEVVLLDPKDPDPMSDDPD